MKKKIEENIVMGEDFSEAPNEYYRKFFLKFKEIETLPNNEWKPLHLIGYFTKKYKTQYNTEYKFKYNNSSPSKSFEMFQIRRLGLMLTTDPILLKEYIDWIFENKIVKAKRKITSISFLTREEHMNEYKFNILLNVDGNIDRSTLLPSKYKDVFMAIGKNLNTYGDLAFISKMSDMPNELIMAFNRLKELGFNESILEKVI